MASRVRNQRTQSPLPKPRAPIDATATMARVVNGDREAFAELYRWYLDSVYRFVYHRVNNRQVAEDLTAETFVRALNGSSRWADIGRDPGAWFMTIARNLVNDHYKSAQQRLVRLTGDVAPIDRVQQGRDGSPDLAAIGAVQNRALLVALQQLLPHQRECLVLRFLLGLNLAETAAAMGLEIGAVKALQYRGVRAMQRLLPHWNGVH